jgi:hypothetical protein
VTDDIPTPADDDERERSIMESNRNRLRYELDKLHAWMDLETEGRSTSVVTLRPEIAARMRRALLESRIMLDRLVWPRKGDTP